MARSKEIGGVEGKFYGYEFDREWSSDVIVYIETDERVLVPNYKVKGIRTTGEHVLVANRNGSIESREVIKRVGRWDFFLNSRKGMEVRNIVKTLTYDFSVYHEGYDELLNGLDELNMSDNKNRRIRMSHNSLEIEFLD